MALYQTPLAAVPHFRGTSNFKLIIITVSNHHDDHSFHYSRRNSSIRDLNPAPSPFPGRPEVSTTSKPVFFCTENFFDHAYLEDGGHSNLTSGIVCWRADVPEEFLGGGVENPGDLVSEAHCAALMLKI